MSFIRHQYVANINIFTERTRFSVFIFWIASLGRFREKSTSEKSSRVKNQLKNSSGLMNIHVVVYAE